MYDSASPLEHGLKESWLFLTNSVLISSWISIIIYRVFRPRAPGKWTYLADQASVRWNETYCLSKWHSSPVIGGLREIDFFW